MRRVYTCGAVSALLRLFLLFPVWTLASQDDERPRDSDPESIEGSAVEFLHPGSLFCSRHLEAGIRKHGGRVTPAQLMELRLSDPENSTLSLWFKNQFSRSVIRQIQVRLNHTEYSEKGLATGERVYLIQQLNLKELNERLLDIGGTQYYLQALDHALFTLLENNPSLGRVVHVNYKDRAIISSLSAPDFEKVVLQALKQLTQSYIYFLGREGGENIDWQGFIDRSLVVGNGKSIEDALFRLRLSMLGLSEPQWRKEISETLSRLNAELRQDESVESMLRKYRAVETDEELCSIWARRYFRPGQAEAGLSDLRRYLELLAVADMLPVPVPLHPWRQRLLRKAQTLVLENPDRAFEQFRAIAHLMPESWSLHRSHFLRASLGSKIIIATDMKGLGTSALIDRHLWVKGGAKVRALSQVYSFTSALMMEKLQKLNNELRLVLGQAEKLRYYASGDDALWSLPSLSEGKLDQLKEALMRHRGDFYIHIESVAETQEPALSSIKLAQAVNRSWKALAELKTSHKQKTIAEMIEAIKGQNSEE